VRPYRPRKPTSILESVHIEKGPVMRYPQIVVGVDGSRTAESALAWAADEARLRGASLLIVHALDSGDSALIARIGEAGLRAADHTGARVLAQHAAAASIRQPGVPVSTMLSHAGPADALLDLSGTVDLVVVGTHGRSSFTESILGSVSHRLAAHAHSPVVLVTRELALAGTGKSPRIVVGVSATPSAELALALAFAEARTRAAVLTVVSTCPAAALQRQLRPYREQYSDVTVDARVAVGEPGNALLCAAHDAQLIVIGCHHSDDRWSTRLGPVPAIVLQSAPCPVIVVGQDHGSPGDFGPAMNGLPPHAALGALARWS
jgi:nucleotide-binding universal stress UspA family protein